MPCCKKTTPYGCSDLASGSLSSIEQIFVATSVRSVTIGPNPGEKRQTAKMGATLELGTVLVSILFAAVHASMPVVATDPSQWGAAPGSQRALLVRFSGRHPTAAAFSALRHAFFLEASLLTWPVDSFQHPEQLLA